MSDTIDFIQRRLEKLEDKIDAGNDKISDQLDIQSKLLSDYNTSLREHMRRTELLEGKVEPMHVKFTEDSIADKIKSRDWKKILMILGAIATVVGIITGIASLK
jgi:hypothetical protein